MREPSSAGIVETDHVDKRNKQTNTQVDIVDIGQYNPSRLIIKDFGGHLPYMTYSQPYPGYGHMPQPQHSPLGFRPIMQPPLNSCPKSSVSKTK
ncbi:hypothetical protein DPMN_085467 [Dreissena polymorpha]|uniref:Uncharacterized protein n=1 Tax=Dreissena polymorpha TaxID=45954 RepID=A0A9D3YH25_DREPO|nr:hypothetical protein DPMN_085467 [Dreissena polymorpha]